MLGIAPTGPQHLRELLVKSSHLGSSGNAWPEFRQPIETTRPILHLEEEKGLEVLAEASDDVSLNGTGGTKRISGRISSRFRKSCRSFWNRGWKRPRHLRIPSALLC